MMTNKRVQRAILNLSLKSRPPPRQVISSFGREKKKKKEEEVEKELDERERFQLLWSGEKAIGKQENRSRPV